MENNKLEKLKNNKKFSKILPTSINNLFKIDENYLIVLNIGEHFILDGYYIDGLDKFKSITIDDLKIIDISGKLI